MAQGYVCDRCGAAIFEGEQTAFTVALSGVVNKSTTEGFDLCPKCASAVENIITTRIITKDTNPASWEAAGDE